MELCSFGSAARLSQSILTGTLKPETPEWGAHLKSRFIGYFSLRRLWCPLMAAGAGAEQQRVVARFCCVYLQLHVCNAACMRHGT